LRKGGEQGLERLSRGFATRGWCDGLSSGINIAGAMMLARDTLRNDLARQWPLRRQLPIRHQKRHRAGAI